MSQPNSQYGGPLTGLKVVEVGGMGPAPFAAMIMADLGADVIRIASPRPSTNEVTPADALKMQTRSRASVSVDLKDPSGIEFVLQLLSSADALLEGFRPGVLERLGLGPDVALERNPSLVYARVTGYGQTGPWAARAGHDINYIAMSGALSAFARRGEAPVPPTNLLGDYGGGGMLAAFGVLSGVFEARSSGRGQVVDVSMVDGVALLSTALHSFRAAGAWNDEPGTNFLDLGAHFYNVYEAADGRYLAVGAVEPQFYAALLDGLGIDSADAPQTDESRWPELTDLLAHRIATRTRQEWLDVFEGIDACVTPVLGLGDALNHEQNAYREVFVNVDGAVQPAPAPRFSRTPAAIRPDQPHHADREAALRAWNNVARR